MQENKNLTDCMTCGKEVAKSARICPHCGEILRRGFNWLALLFHGFYYTGYGKLGKGILLLLITLIPYAFIAVGIYCGLKANSELPVGKQNFSWKSALLVFFLSIPCYALSTYTFTETNDTVSHIANSITNNTLASSNTAQTLIFRNTTKPIGELFGSHPQVKNVEWKDMPVLGEGVVVATVTFSATSLEVEGYDLNEIEKERQGFITIQCVDNSGMIISIESTSYVKDGNDVACVDIAYFLEILEKKENMAYGCWGMSPDAFVVLLQSGAL